MVHGNVVTLDAGVQELDLNREQRLNLFTVGVDDSDINGHHVFNGFAFGGRGCLDGILNFTRIDPLSNNPAVRRQRILRSGNVNKGISETRLQSLRRVLNLRRLFLLLLSLRLLSSRISLRSVLCLGLFLTSSRLGIGLFVDFSLLLLLRLRRCLRLYGRLRLGLVDRTLFLLCSLGFRRRLNLRLILRDNWLFLSSSFLLLRNSSLFLSSKLLLFRNCRLCLLQGDRSGLEPRGLQDDLARVCNRLRREHLEDHREGHESGEHLCEGTRALPEPPQVLRPLTHVRSFVLVVPPPPN